MLAAALARLERDGMRIVRTAPAVPTDPVGPSSRRYANSAAVVETPLEPAALLAALKEVEREFGRRLRGQRWSSRVLDLDIILWSGGAFAGPGLIVPHRLFRARRFVLAPAVGIAAHWRDPVTGLTVRHLHARLTRPRAGHR